MVQDSGIPYWPTHTTEPDPEPEQPKKRQNPYSVSIQFFFIRSKIYDELVAN